MAAMIVNRARSVQKFLSRRDGSTEVGPVAAPCIGLPLAAKRTLRRFRRHRSGSAAVEFALIALVSLELLTEAMQAGLYFYDSAGVERATWTASRQILTGNVSGQGLTATQFRSNVLCPAISSAHLSCANLITNVQKVSEDVAPNGFYSLLNTTQTGLTRPALNNSQTSYCIGTDGSYVFVQILYAMPVFSPFWKAFATNFNGTASYIIQSTAAFRNEPFQANTTAC